MKLVYLISQVFLAWTFYNFLARSVVLEDKDLEVRQSAINSLAILVCYLDHDSNKTDSTLEILGNYLFHIWGQSK